MGQCTFFAQPSFVLQLLQHTYDVDDGFWRKRTDLYAPYLHTRCTDDVFGCNVLSHVLILLLFAEKKKVSECRLFFLFFY